MWVLCSLLFVLTQKVIKRIKTPKASWLNKSICPVIGQNLGQIYFAHNIRPMLRQNINALQPQMPTLFCLIISKLFAVEKTLVA